MKKYLNNKDRFRYIRLFISFLLISALFYKLALGYYAAKYTESAHGNSPSGIGVNRTGLKTPIDFGYAVGNCVHCHEQHASIGGNEPSPAGGPDQFLLFYPSNPISQTDNFCFQCHKGAGSVQYPNGIPYVNDDYGSQFGGGTANSTSIKDAFAFGPPVGVAPASSHNLQKVRNWWMARPRGDWVTTNTNACVVCHPPHYAQKNHDPYTNYKTAVRRPSHPSPTGENAPRNLWGDEAGSEYNEMMNEYTLVYQAPYRVGGNYEPAGQATPTDGSNLPNFAGFCLTCHGVAINNHDAPTMPAGSDLRAIEWGTGTDAPYDRHGKRVGWKNNMGGTVKAPYTEGRAGGYCLACTDCHEPHGSPNPFLLRTCVNGTDGITVTSGGDGYWKLYYFCAACHNLQSHALGPGFGPDGNCTQNGACHVHRAYF